MRQITEPTLRRHGAEGIARAVEGKFPVASRPVSEPADQQVANASVMEDPPKRTKWVPRREESMPEDC
jgi:hypothetical protein